MNTRSHRSSGPTSNPRTTLRVVAHECGVDGFLHYVGGMEVSQEPGIERLLGLKASCESFLLLLESCSERLLR